MQPTPDQFLRGRKVFIRTALLAVDPRCSVAAVDHAIVEVLDRLHDEGEVDASLLHSDPEFQRRIAAQPMLVWKAQNVRRHLAGGS